MARLAAGPRLGRGAARAARRYAAPCLSRLRPRARAEPQHAQPSASTGASRASPAAARRRHRGVPSRIAPRRAGAPASASPPTRACSSTPAASPPRSTSTSSPTRWRGSARRTCCSRSAPGRRRRGRASASSSAVRRRRRRAGDHPRRAPTPSSTPATRRPSACRCSRRWPAARRSSCARPRAWPSSPTARCGLAVERGTGAAFADAIAALFARRPRRSGAPRRRGPRPATGSSVLPGLLDHYRRLLEARGGIAVAGAAGVPLEASSLPPAR